MVPRRTGEWIADTASGIAHAIKAAERQEVRRNLSVLLGLAADSPRVTAAARNVYRNFGRSCVDLLYEVQTRSGRIPANLRIENLPLFDQAVKEGRGVILLGAHTGAWELGALALAGRGYSITAPVEAPAGRRVQELYRRERDRFGLKPIPLGSGMIKCMRTLKAGGVLGLLGDRAFGSACVRTEFFGRPADLPQGPARLSMACASPILSASMRRTADGTYLLKFGSRIDPLEGVDPGSFNDHQKKVAALIEALIAEAPEEWFCFESLWSKMESGR